MVCSAVGNLVELAGRVRTEKLAIFGTGVFMTKRARSPIMSEKRRKLFFLKSGWMMALEMREAW